MLLISKYTLLLLLPMLLMSCGKDNSVATTNAVQTSTEESDLVWVMVNGSPIHQSELDYARHKLLGDQFVDARVEENIRQSLISSRAIAQKAETTLSADELAEIDLATRSYREEMLLKSYLQNISVPMTVSEDMVADYYAQHPQEFGATTITDLELLKAVLDGQPSENAKIISRLSNARNQDDWSQINHNSDTPISYQKTRSNQQLSSRLLSVIKNLSVGAISDVIIDGKWAYVVKVVKKQDIPPKPLAEVSRDIRKRLAAEELKKSIKALSDEVVAESQIDRKD